MHTLTTLPRDAFVTAAFAELLDDVTSLLTACQQQKPLDREEISFWKRQLNALNKAEAYFAQGVRPAISGAAYLVASASRPGALVHRLIKQGGIVVCSCEAGQKAILCWHHLLINVLERASELESLAAERAMEEVSSGPAQTPEAAAVLLTVRLAETAAILDAMRQAQGRSALAFGPPDIPDEPYPSEGDIEPPDRPRALGWRLATARKKSAYFASAFYLEAA